MLSAVLSFAAALVASTSAACSNFISCPCGLSNNSYTFCIDSNSAQENPCARWSQCESCVEGYPYCFRCPTGRSGRLCTKVSRGKLIRRKRQNGYDYDIYCVPLDFVRYGKTVVHTLQGAIVEDNDEMEYPLGTKLEYSCNPGYILEGKEFLKCESSGFWSSPAPNCTLAIAKNTNPIYCVPRDPIFNGRVVVHTTDGMTVEDSDDLDYPVGTELEYTCHFGYYLNGTDKLRCDEYGFWTGLPPECVKACGKSMVEPNHKVTGGNKTVAGEWPWMVAISVPTRNGYTSMICGGALLDKRTVLSAAHCFNGTSTNYVLHFGKLYRRDIVEKGLEVRRSVEIIKHEKFDPETYVNDIALIKLESNLPYTEKIQPICLPTPRTTRENLVPGNRGYLTGYGVTETQLRADELLMAQLEVQSDRRCMESYRKNNISLDVTPGMFCAGFQQGIISACKGDSGSPFVFYNATSHSYTLEGCVSFNLRGQCAQPGRFTVFTRILHYLPWIKKNRRRRT